MPHKSESHSQQLRRRGRRVTGRQYGEQRRHDPEIAVYKTQRWLHVRARVRREEPLCRDPYGHHEADKRIVSTMEIDHIVPLRVDMSLAFVRSNLQGLCVLCHRRKTIDDLRKYPMRQKR